MKIRQIITEMYLLNMFAYPCSQAASTVLSLAEREAMLEEAKRKKEELLQECEQRKNYMQTMEMNRKDNEKLSDLEQVSVSSKEGGVREGRKPQN